MTSNSANSVIKADGSFVITETPQIVAEAIVSRKFREDSLANFNKLGLPASKNEEWRYTNLKTIQTSFDKEIQKGNIDLVSFLSQKPFAKIESHKLVFVNGVFNKNLSSVIGDKTIAIQAISSLDAENMTVFKEHFSKIAKDENECFVQVNSGLFKDGVFVLVKANSNSSLPVSIVNICDKSESHITNHVRNLIVLEKNSSLTIFESFYAIGENASFLNSVNEIVISENAFLKHYKIQDEGDNSHHVGYTQVFQEKNSNIENVTLTVSGSFVRNNLHYYLNGQGCNSTMYGLYLSDDENIVDNHSRVDHAMPNCFSDELYKGILKGKSTAVFNGKIIVHLDAQKTNAYQRNQNVLLSDEATINTKPQLEIFADDVKCTHGATVGKLDEKALFYLRSRGISEDSGRRLLLRAFADEIIEHIKIEELKTLLEEEILERI